MCTGGDPGGGSGSDQSQPLNPPRVRKAPKGSGPAAEKQREVGVTRKPASGLSPGAARAITGSDKAAANLAGRSDITKEQLGDLQTRAKGGRSSLPGPVGTILGGIGQASANRLLNKLKGDTPTIGKLGDKPSYSVKPVTDPKTGRIVGVTEPGPFGGRVYSGRPEFNPNAPKQQKDDSPPPPPPAASVEEPAVEVAQMGGGTLTTKRRRGSGRRTAFGTRQSLVNLRNV